MIASWLKAATSRGCGSLRAQRTFGGGPTAAYAAKPCEPVCRDERRRPPLRVTLVEGHGSGPAVCAAVRKVLAAAGVRVQWDRQTIRVHRDPRTGRQTVGADLLRSAEDTGLVLHGSDSGSAPDGSDGSPALALHKAIDAFVGVREFASDCCFQPYKSIDVINVRDNVSGEYSEIEHTVVPGVVQVIKTVSRQRSEAVAKCAFEYAVAHRRCRITALHKANVMRLSDGMFLRACRRVSACYPTVTYAEEKLDKFCLRVTEDPSRYDVLLTPSLYGGIASAVCGTLSGGVSGVPSATYGPRVVVFGAMDHGDTPCVPKRFRSGGDDGRPGELVSGRHLVVNPTGLMRSAVWMLNHVGMFDVGHRITEALRRSFQQGVRTPDMGGYASCDQFTNAVIRNLTDAEDECPSSENQN